MTFIVIHREHSLVGANTFRLVRNSTVNFFFFVAVCNFLIESIFAPSTNRKVWDHRTCSNVRVRQPLWGKGAALNAQFYSQKDKIDSNASPLKMEKKNSIQNDQAPFWRPHPGEISTHACTKTKKDQKVVRPLQNGGSVQSKRCTGFTCVPRSLIAQKTNSQARSRIHGIAAKG